MIKRWLRRRLAVRGPGLGRADPEDDEDRERERGKLVRKGRLVSLRTHVPANRAAFQRWYADPEIAELLRHDLEPLNEVQSRGYFDTFILPSSARGLCFAIHERRSKRLIGTTALTDFTTGTHGRSALFRIVIGEKDLWGKGYGTEATQLVVQQAFDELELGEVRLEVFNHNARARAAYNRVGFEITGQHVEWVPRRQVELQVVEMRLSRAVFMERAEAEASRPRTPFAGDRLDRERRRDERAVNRERRLAERRQTRARRAGDRAGAAGGAGPERDPTND